MIGYKNMKSFLIKSKSSVPVSGQKKTNPVSREVV